MQKTFQSRTEQTQNLTSKQKHPLLFVFMTAHTRNVNDVKTLMQTNIGGEIIQSEGPRDFTTATKSRTRSQQNTRKPLATPFAKRLFLARQPNYQGSNDNAEGDSHGAKQERHGNNIEGQFHHDSLRRIRSWIER